MSHEPKLHLGFKINRSMKRIDNNKTAYYWFEGDAKFLILAFYLIGKPDENEEQNSSPMLDPKQWLTLITEAEDFFTRKMHNPLMNLLI